MLCRETWGSDHLTQLVICGQGERVPHRCDAALFFLAGTCLAVARDKLMAPPTSSRP